MAMDFQLKNIDGVDDRSARNEFQKIATTGHDQKECSKVSIGCWQRIHETLVLAHKDRSAPHHIPLLFRSHIKDWCLGMISGLDIRFQSCSESASGSTTERWLFSPDWMDFLRVLARYVAIDIDTYLVLK
jgi:hypothetical protein